MRRVAASGPPIEHEAIRGLPTGTLLRDTDGDVWRLGYDHVDGVEQAVLRLQGTRLIPIVRTIDSCAVFGPFRLAEPPRPH